MSPNTPPPTPPSSHPIANSSLHSIHVSTPPELPIDPYTPKRTEEISPFSVDRYPVTYESPHGESTDPLCLSMRRKDANELRHIRRTSRKGKKIVNFYERQNALIDSLLGPIEDNNIDRQGNNTRKLKIAIWGSVMVNICLFCLQLVAAIISGSLSLLATMADSFMDLLSSGVLLFAERAANRTSFINYPTGSSRMETAGIIIFSSLMATVSLQLIIEGIKALIAMNHSIDVNYVAIGLVSGALASKLILFLYCRLLPQYPSAVILAQDHRNDLVINSFGLISALLASHTSWIIDPIGAIIIALFILRSWVSTAYEHVQLIIGKSADSEFLQRITYIAMTHSPEVLQVDTAKAYHLGNNYFVEVDIVLPPEMPLHEAHDIGESLQTKLESMGNVERAFVHLDYETEHKPEHRKNK